MDYRKIPLALTKGQHERELQQIKDYRCMWDNVLGR